jgi:hypothetical protein
MTSQEKAVNQTGFSRTISTEDKCERTDGEPLGVSKSLEVSEPKSREHSFASGFANANAAVGYHDQGPHETMQIQPLKGSLHQLQVASTTFFIETEEQDSGVTPWRMVTQVGKTFVGCD